jgi:hypothetical protein
LVDRLFVPPQSVVAMCAGALCSIVTCPMGVQLVLENSATAAAAAHLTKKYASATSTPEERAEMLRQVSRLCLLCGDVCVHLVKQYEGKTRGAETCWAVTSQASGLALVEEGLDALVNCGLPRLVWVELTRELLSQEDLSILLQVGPSFLPPVCTYQSFR